MTDLTKLTEIERGAYLAHMDFLKTITASIFKNQSISILGKDILWFCEEIDKDRGLRKQKQSIGKRINKCLSANEIKTVRDLVNFRRIAVIPGIGDFSLHLIKKKLEFYGLMLGMSDCEIINYELNR